MHAIVGRAAREIGDPSAIEHRLGRRAAIVDAGAADIRALDERGLPAGAGTGFRQRIASLTGADNDGVVVIHLGAQA